MISAMLQNSPCPPPPPVLSGGGWMRLVVLFLLLSANSRSALARQLVTNLAQLHALSADEIAAAPAARLRAQVTFNDPQWNVLYLADTFRGASVHRSTAFTNHPVGAWVEVTGEVRNTPNGPTIQVTDIRELPADEVALPPLQPRLVSLDALVLGHDDAQWVAIEGVIRSILPEVGSWTMELGNPTASVTVHLVDPLSATSQLAADLINARVRVVGVCTASEPGRPVTVYCGRRSDIRVLAASPVTLFEEALVPLGALSGMADTFEAAHRIRVRATVTYVDPEKTIYLSDGQYGLAVDLQGDESVQDGDALEVAGFLSLRNEEPRLVLAEIRLLGPGVAPPPILVGSDTHFGAAHLAGLIRVQGRLVVRDRAAGHYLLTLARPELDELFVADLRFEHPATNLGPWMPDSLMEVTGIWVGLSPERGLAGTLLCRTPADLRVVQLPHWWTPKRLRLLVSAVAVFSIGAVLWAIHLRGQNRAKVEQLRRQVANELVVERRYRELFENATDTLLILDAESTVLDLNPAAELVFGKRSSELMGRPLMDELGPASQAHLREILESALATSLGGRFELSLPPRPDGRVITLEISSCRRLRRPVGEQIQIIAHDITERKQAEAELAELNRRLLETSRRAGMAEVATNVLHNVGNVLNSVNVTTTLIHDGMRDSKVASLDRVVTLLEEHQQDPGGFFSSHAKGVQLTQYLRQLSTHLLSEQAAMLTDLKSLTRNVEHIKGIVARQQDHRGAAGVRETVLMATLVEEACALCTPPGTPGPVAIVREFAPMPLVPLDQHQVLQILVNLLRNALQSVERAGAGETGAGVVIRTEWDGAEWIRVQVSDTGVGIAPENLTRIFAHGFTTKPGGHGFGLHSSALAARAMGGSLRAESAGPGFGATFTLELPVKPAVEVV